jgi:uncharacterized protein involved in type VI secretion and phage assembly
MNMNKNDESPDLGGCTKRFFGKYRGKVINNLDPEGRGRIRASVPDLSSEPLSWAMPCHPLGGDGMGIFAVPPKGASVWIEFEQGDPDFPVWVGCFWGDASKLPSPSKDIPPSTSSIALQTSGKDFVLISDKDGIKLQTKSGASISINNNEIKIENGQGASIELSGPSVKINQGALEIK